MDKTMTMIIAYGFLLVFAGVMWYIAQHDNKTTAKTQQ